MSELNPIGFAASPPAAKMPGAAPSLEDVHAIARDMALGLLPPPGGLSAAPSPPGVGIALDIYDTVGFQGLGVLGGGKSAETLAGLLNGEFAQGLSTAEPMVPRPDFPYLKPLGADVGRAFNALI